LHHSVVLPHRLVSDELLAETDVEDRDLQLTGAIRIVTSLAAVDGLVLLSPSLEVHAFGVKIRTDRAIGKVYDGREFVRRGSRATKVDQRQFGTRHGSLLRYCRLDPKALGVVVSQDGRVRVIMTIGRSLVMWSDVKLLAYSDDLRRQIQIATRRLDRRLGKSFPKRLGYSPMPKTIAALEAWSRKVRRRGKT